MIILIKNTQNHTPYMYYYFLNDAEFVFFLEKNDLDFDSIERGDDPTWKLEYAEHGV